jgi:CubicO group peptidase (beta-lactamase class C family)
MFLGRPSAIVALMLLFLVPACSNLSSNVISANSSETTNSLSETVDDLVLPLVTSGHNVGIVVGVLDESGHQHVYGYGRESLESEVVPDGDTLFAIGSLTKSFSSLLYYKLSKEGLVNAGDTLGDILYGQFDFSEASKRITLGQLVNHESGLPRQPNDWEMLGSLIHYSFTGDDIYSHIDRRKVYDFLKTFDPPVGSIGQYRYSNMGMGLFGHLIETKTQKSLDELLTKELFLPLGIGDTSYVIDPVKRKRLAAGYVGDSPCFLTRDTPVPLWEMNDIFKGAAGLYSTVNDLLKLARYRLTLHDIPIITLPINSFWGSGVGEPKYQQLSLGWEVDAFLDKGGTVIYQHGMIAGYSAYMGIVPEKNIAVIVLYNNFDWDDEIGHNLLLNLMQTTKVTSGASDEIR